MMQEKKNKLYVIYFYFLLSLSMKVGPKDDYNTSDKRSIFPRILK